MFDRDEQEISQIIENGLEAILSGRATLESVVSQHPEQAEVIRPELEGALWLVSQRQEVEARPGFVTASRKRVVERIKAEAKSQSAKHSLFGFAWPRQHVFQMAAGMMVILMLVLGTGGIVSISQSSLPGDGLYAVKRISETVSYGVTLSEVQRVQLSAQFAERRINEVETLVASGSFAAASSTLGEYKQQVNLTVALLDKVSNTLAQEKLGVAVAFKNDLVENSGRLDTLLASAPEILQGQIEDAKAITSIGVANTEALIHEIPVANPSGTSTPTGTMTLVGTPTPNSTETAANSDTPAPEKKDPRAGDTETLTLEPPLLEATPDPSTNTLTPEDPTSTMTPGEKATQEAVKTKKPVPTQKPQPATSNNNNSNNSNSEKEKDNNKGGKDK